MEGVCSMGRRAHGRGHTESEARSAASEALWSRPGPVCAASQQRPRGRAGGVTARGLRFLTSPAGSDSGSTDLAGWARGRVETGEACG